MWYSNDTVHYTFKAELVTLVSLKVPSGVAGLFLVCTAHVFLDPRMLFFFSRRKCGDPD